MLRAFTLVRLLVGLLVGVPMFRALWATQPEPGARWFLVGVATLLVAFHLAALRSLLQGRDPFRTREITLEYRAVWLGMGVGLAMVAAVFLGWKLASAL